MNQRTIGGQSIGEIGLGCMGMSWAYGQADKAEALRTLDRAVELGVNHWDTADVYGAGENEKLLAEALKRHREKVFLATKFGNVFDRALTTHQDLAAANPGWMVDGTPAYARKCIENSLRRLQVDHVDLYYLHRIDDRVPIEDTIGAMAEFVKEGKARHIGISEAAASTVRRAHSTHPLAAVQNELSLWTRDYEDDVVPLCGELGITFVAYSPLGRGFLTGRFRSPEDLEEGDARRNHPRFQGENFSMNLRIVETVKSIAEARGATPAQIALAWVLSKSKNIVPIPGTKRVAYLEENAEAASVHLNADEIGRLNGIETTSGLRYAEQGMTFVNR